MVDTATPISNFHPYRTPAAVPHSEEPEQGLPGVLEKVGVDPDRYRNLRDRVKSMNARDWLARAGEFARSRPAMIITGIAVAVIGARLIRKRMM